MAEELEAVGLGPAECLLVAVDDAGFVVFNLAQGDEPFARAALFRSRYCVLLEVHINAGLGVRRQHAGLDGGVEPLGGAGVDVVGFGRGLALAELEANQVVRAERVVSLLHFRGDLVVGLGDEAFQRRARLVRPEAQGAKGIDGRHR